MHVIKIFVLVESSWCNDSTYFSIDIAMKLFEVFSMLHDTLQEIVVFLLATLLCFQFLSLFKFLSQTGFAQIL